MCCVTNTRKTPKADRNRQSEETTQKRLDQKRQTKIWYVDLGQFTIELVAILFDVMINDLTMYDQN